MKWSIRARKIRLKNSELRRAIGWCLQSLGHTQCMIDLPILSSNIWLWVKTLVLHWYPGYCTQMIRWLWDRSSKYGNTLWLFNIAMGNYLFIDGLPIKNGDFPWRTVSHNQMVGFDMFWPIPIYPCSSPGCVRVGRFAPKLRRDLWLLWDDGVIL